MNTHRGASRPGRGSAHGGSQRSDERGEVLLAGPHAVGALLDHGAARVRRVIYVAAGNPLRVQLAERARAAGAQIEATSPQALDKLAGEIRHQGILAWAAPAEYADWEDLIAAPDALIVAFDQVTDPHNLGAILRSAEALGGSGALVTRDRCAHPNATVGRTSAGASEILPISIETNLARSLEAAQEAGLQVIGADLDGVAPWRVDFKRPTVLVVGAEGSGLRASTRARCSALVTIPLPGRTESLNASAAAAALLYEARRQRNSTAATQNA